MTGVKEYYKRTLIKESFGELVLNNRVDWYLSLYEIRGFVGYGAEGQGIPLTPYLRVPLGLSVRRGEGVRPDGFGRAGLTRSFPWNHRYLSTVVPSTVVQSQWRGRIIWVFRQICQDPYVSG